MINKKLLLIFFLNLISHFAVSQTIKSIKIGNQTWAIENLNVEKFRNGDKIAYASNSNEWLAFFAAKEPAWCYWEFDSKNSKYGKFYNGYSAIDKRFIAPLGWKLPSEKDFIELMNYLEGGPVSVNEEIDNIRKVASSKLRSQTEWIGLNGNNSSSFSAFPYGSVQTDPKNKKVSFINFGVESAFWSNELNFEGSFISMLQLIGNPQEFCCNGVVGNWIGHGCNIRLMREDNFVDNISAINTSDKIGCIEGDCFNGYGVYRFNDGNVYKGESRNNKRNGKGLFVWSNGDSYEGDWVSDARQGRGIFKWSSGDSYEGDMVNNTSTGKGILKFSNGSSYVGDFVSDKFQGYGIMYFANGDKYDGEWVAGVKQGEGKLTYSSGKIEEGKWVNNQFISSNSISQKGNNYGNNQQYTNNTKNDSSNFKEGEKCIEGNCIDRGTILYSNGDTFSGTFLGLGVKSEGKYKWVNGDIYVGTFNKGQFVYGELKYGDITYTGGFLNDKYNGIGTLVTDDASYQGGFKEGKFYGYGELYVNMYKATIKGDWNGSYMVGKVYAKDYVSPKIIYENGEFKSFNNSSKVNELANILLEFIKTDNISASSYTTSYSHGNSTNGLSKIYNGNYYGKKDVIGYFETGKIYDGNYYGKKDIIGYIEDGKIYSGNYYGKKDVVGYYENGKIYNGNYYGKKDVIGYYEDGKIYTGNYYGKKDIVGYYENGGATAAAAAFLLLL
jgi:uncharacterized protein (TIGR02145 family)